MRKIPEPCLCGAPDCGRCFPGNNEVDINEDEAYDRSIQAEQDEFLFDSKREELLLQKWENEDE
tara:strand:- start:180 stop:371 length:192 start_codon:yes stop_codon:yes gene_type:complete